MLINVLMVSTCHFFHFHVEHLASITSDVLPGAAINLNYLNLKVLLSPNFSRDRKQLVRGSRSRGQVTGKWWFESEPGTSGFLVSVMLSIVTSGKKPKPNRTIGGVLQKTLTCTLDPL